MFLTIQIHAFIYPTLGSASNCPDKKTSNVASSIVGIWHQTPIRWSAIACNIENQNDDWYESGNELMKDDMKFRYGALNEIYGGGGLEVGTYQ